MQPAACVRFDKHEENGMTSFTSTPGRPHPIGATPDDTGVNFSLYSQYASRVELLLFAHSCDLEPQQTLQLDPAINRTFFFWHIHVDGLTSGWHYAYRVDGPRDLHKGYRFNPAKVLLDPYAKGLSNRLWNRMAACGDGDNLGQSMRCEVIDSANYDWEGDRPLGRAMEESIVYEVHVRGFTAYPSSGESCPGTFRAFMGKIPYLQELGVTAVELMPIFDFDETEVTHEMADGTPLRNY